MTLEIEIEAAVCFSLCWLNFTGYGLMQHQVHFGMGMMQS